MFSIIRKGLWKTVSLHSTYRHPLGGGKVAYEEKRKQYESEEIHMTIMEQLNGNIPEYSRYMYLQGYTPEQIMAALHKKMLREAKERADAEEIPVVKIISEVKIK